MNFTSDNAVPAHPAVLDAIVRANGGAEPSYGTEVAMTRVCGRLRQIFEAPEAAIYLVATGTAANALALACLCPPWAAVYCHRSAHVATDECGAPEFFSGGAKLTLVEGEHGRIAPAALERALALTTEGFVHSVQRGALTLTNATEAGTVYAPEEVARLAGIAKAAGVPVHMDGARFANAMAALGCTPAELTWKAGVDVLSFGATKNGCLGVEAVILFDPSRAWEFELRRKRGGHLFSKHRFLSAQMEAYLADGLWLGLAGAANARAAELSRGLAAVPGATLLAPTEANGVFAAWPRAGHLAAEAAGARYFPWRFAPEIEPPESAAPGARLVCGWSTTVAEVARFIEVVRAGCAG